MAADKSHEQLTCPVGEKVDRFDRGVELQHTSGQTPGQFLRDFLHAAGDQSSVVAVVDEIACEIPEGVLGRQPVGCSGATAGDAGIEDLEHVGMSASEVLAKAHRCKS